MVSEAALPDEDERGDDEQAVPGGPKGKQESSDGGSQEPQHFFGDCVERVRSPG